MVGVARGDYFPQLDFDATYICGDYYLPALLEALHRRHPGIRYQIGIGNSSQVIENTLAQKNDIGTLLIAGEAGCIIEAPDGRPLRAPLDTTTPVAWMGYANATLARTVRPVLRRLMARYFE